MLFPEPVINEQWQGMEHFQPSAHLQLNHISIFNEVKSAIDMKGKKPAHNSAPAPKLDS